MGKCRILLADDHTLVAAAFKNLLEPEFDVVGVAPDGRELLRLAEELRPQIILLDLNMPLLNGFDAGKQLKRILPETKLIVLTMSEDPGLADYLGGPRGKRGDPDLTAAAPLVGQHAQDGRLADRRPRR